MTTDPCPLCPSNTMNQGAIEHGTHRILRSQQKGDGGPRRAPVRLRVRSEDLQERLQSRLGRVGRAAEDAAQRISPPALDAAGAAVPGAADGGVLFRRRRRPARRVRPSVALTFARRRAFPFSELFAFSEKTAGDHESREPITSLL